MTRYELMYLVPATCAEDELGKVSAPVRDVVAKHGGRITFEDNLGKKRLAYPIKKVQQCYYLMAHFEAEPGQIKALDHDLKLADVVVRHLVIKRSEVTRPAALPPAAPAPTAAQAQEDLARAKLEDLDRKLDELLTKDII